jgi:glycogen phosphorylase
VRPTLGGADRVRVLSRLVRAIRRFTVRTVLPEALAELDGLARNLRWSWHVPTRDLFARLDPGLWDEVGGDPLRLLAALSPDRLSELAADKDVVARVRSAAQDLRVYLSEPRWYQRVGRNGDGHRLPRSIAYFSPEFGVAEVLPQYSGGLGILAGDHLKSASDLGVPMVGVGLLYRGGYFTQQLDREGWQLEHYPVLDTDALPLALLREADGTPAQVSLDLPEGRTLHAQVWTADVGRVPLLLLDSAVPANDERGRRVADRLYGGGGEHRLEQELLLGVGGVRALRVWSRLTGADEPEVHHTNEGHAGFLGVERIRELVRAEGLGFDEALQVVRAGTVFTTHTPVPAGIDRFEADVVRRYVEAGLATEGVAAQDVLALGAETYDGGDPTLFNMAVMGLRLAARANGVSTLHGQVSRGMFHGLWPDVDASEVPITAVTNGVHSPTWADRRLAELAATRLTQSEIADGSGWTRADGVTDSELWEARAALRAQLVEDVRRRLRASWRHRGASRAELGWVEEVLDPDVLTIGFARRVPTYKRLTLMLRDPERLRRLLLHPDRPVQLVVAGKAHPADEQGKRLIQQMVRFADGADVRHRVVFLPDHDIAMAQTMYAGCDVWLNNPLRPLEACGTSGMKAALNGGLNLSVLDGWWDEWFDGDNGWAIPTADGVDDAERRDDLESAALYDLVEQQVAVRFYDRDARGLPPRWLAMVRHTLATLSPKVQATRMVADYVHRLYVPAARAGRALETDRYDGARRLAAWTTRVREGWSEVRVERVESVGMDETAGPGAELGAELVVRAEVTLGGLAPEDVAVQMLHGRVSATGDLEDPRTDDLSLVGSTDPGRHVFSASVRLEEAGPFGYTVRAVPRHPGLASLAETGLVTYAR